MIKNPIGFCLLLLGLSGPLLAQTERKIQFRTLCLEQVTGFEKVTLPNAKDPSKDQQLVLYKDLSPVAEGTFPGGDAVFVAEKPGADGKRVILGKAPLAKSSQQLFIFIPGTGAEGTPPYRVVAYDDDLKSFAPGNVRAINFAPVSVRFVLSGETTPQVPPGKFAFFPHSKKIDEYKMYPAVVEFQGADGAWVKGQSTTWKANTQRREIVITLVDAQTKQPTVRMFSDFAPWTAAP